MIRSPFAAASATVFALALLGCPQNLDPVEPSIFPSGEPVEYFDEPKTTVISGFVFDPEAYFWSLQTCGNCGSPFVELPSPHLRRSAIQGAEVVLVDSQTGAEVATSSTSDQFGAFIFPDVPSLTDGGTYYPKARPKTAPFLPQPQSPDPIADPEPLQNPAVPDAGYLPATILRPIPTSETFCYVPRIVLAPTNGVLDAVARLLTSEGTPTTVADFLDTNRFGGVIVNWVYVPGFWDLNQNADRVQTLATAGRSIDIAWLPPNSGSVPPGRQSRRGFFTATPTSPATFTGISVTLLPPSTLPSTVSFLGMDRKTSAAEQRPWAFTVRTHTIRPGEISYHFFQPELGPERLINSPSGLLAVPFPDAFLCAPAPGTQVL